MEILIATRVKGEGDTWKLVSLSDSDKQICYSLTETLEAFYQNTKYVGDFLISPLKGEIYVKGKAQPKIIEPKKFNIYGDL